MVWMQRQSQGPQEWFRPLEVCIGPMGTLFVNARAKGVAWPHQSSFILSLLTAGAAPLYKLWAHTSMCGWPTHRVGLKSELIPGKCMTFTEDLRHWQLLEHSTGRTSKLTTGFSFAEVGQRAVSSTVRFMSTHKSDREHHPIIRHSLSSAASLRHCEGGALTSSASKNRAKRGGKIPTLTARQTNQPGVGKEWGLAIRWKVRRGSQSA